MKSELLAPAGNLEKLKTAFLYGADAVYVGGKKFSLRSFADNFTLPELEEGVTYAHARGKRVYVAVNIYARNADLGELKEYFCALERAGADGAIVSDAGVIALAKKAAPRLALHLSTQANTTNKYAVKFWAEQGVSRVVLARELSVREIGEIRDYCPETELEAFVHGAMCISYSGRCLLSDYLGNRCSNRGECVQACRWEYAITPVLPERESAPLSVCEDGRGTYILNSKDLNLLAHLAELEEAGVDSFKIEGRMKSRYYLATVVNAYRRALNGEDESVCAEELENVAHRAYTTAYAFGANPHTVSYENSQTKGRAEYIADVLGWENGRAAVQMRNRFFAGEELEILSAGENFKKTVRVESLRDPKGEDTRDARLVQGRYTFDSSIELKVGEILRRKEKREK